MQEGKHNLAIILFQPEIPPNTGNIIRLCANTGCELHLVKPLGFPLEDTKLRRAGLDYHEYANVIVHNDWDACKSYFKSRRIIAIETCGTKYIHESDFKIGDAILFGSETKGLPQHVLDSVNFVVRIPMQNGSRSLNLSNSVAIVVYESWRQLGYISGV